MITMNNEISEFLFKCSGWVRARELASIFNCDERELRGDLSPLRHVAISGNDGYKHIMNATNDEFAHWKNRIRGHALSELNRVSIMERIREPDGQQTFLIEKDGEAKLAYHDGEGETKTFDFY